MTRGRLPQKCPGCDADLRDQGVPARLVRRGLQDMFSLVLIIEGMYACPFCRHRWEVGT